MAFRLAQQLLGVSGVAEVHKLLAIANLNGPNGNFDRLLIEHDDLSVASALPAFVFFASTLTLSNPTGASALILKIRQEPSSNRRTVSAGFEAFRAAPARDLCGASRRACQKNIFHKPARVDVLSDFQLFNSCRGR